MLGVLDLYKTNYCSVDVSSSYDDVFGVFVCVNIILNVCETLSLALCIYKRRFVITWSTNPQYLSSNTIYTRIHYTSSKAHL